MALQTIVSRNVSPWQNSVVSVGAFLSGNAGNVVPQNAPLRFSIRNMDPEFRKMVLDKVRSMTKAQAEAFNCTRGIREGIPGAGFDKHSRKYALGNQGGPGYFWRGKSG